MHELIPEGAFQGLPAIVLDGGAPRATGPDWMREAAGASPGPFVLRHVDFPANDDALERLLSSREEAPLVWRLQEIGASWPATPSWTVLDVTPLLAAGVGLDAAAMRVALAELPPMGAPDEVVIRSCSVAPGVLDELVAWLDPRHAWLVVGAADVPTATRVVSRCLTTWGVREQR